MVKPDLVGKVFQKVLSHSRTSLKGLLACSLSLMERLRRCMSTLYNIISCNDSSHTCYFMVQADRKAWEEKTFEALVDVMKKFFL